MNLQQVKEKIKKMGWYYQGVLVKRLYISYSWFSCSNIKIFSKKIPVCYSGVMNLNDDFLDVYFSKESLKGVAEFYFQKQKKDSKFIFNFYEKLENEAISLFLKEQKKLLKENFSNCSDKKLLELFKSFNDGYLKVWDNLIFLDSFDYYGENLLEQFLKEEKLKIKLKDLDVLLTPESSSFIQRERLSLLTIAEKVLKEKGLLSDIIKKDKEEIFKKYYFLKKDLKKHNSNFHWLHNDYTTILNLGIDYFYVNLINLLKDKENYNKETEMKNDLNKVKLKKEKISKKYKFSERQVSIINFFSFLIILRDARKSYNQMANSVIKKFVLEFSKRMNIDVDQFENLFCWEVEKVFKSNRLLLSKEMKNRVKNSHNFYVLNLGSEYKSFSDYELFYNDDAKNLNDFMKELIEGGNKLCGRSAFVGVVKGSVKIIRGKDDFYKMGKGDILVAPNTRPEYLPIIKLAKAIITDEGGITCHATIVSREFKIPCIVGMQGVSSKLKDGDLVEVDADNGVVRILKQKKL